MRVEMRVVKMQGNHFSSSTGALEGCTEDTQDKQLIWEQICASALLI